MMLPKVGVVPERSDRDTGRSWLRIDGRFLVLLQNATATRVADDLRHALREWKQKGKESS